MAMRRRCSTSRAGWRPALARGNMASLQADVDTLVRSGYLNPGPGSNNALQVKRVSLCQPPCMSMLAWSTRAASQRHAIGCSCVAPARGLFKWQKVHRVMGAAAGAAEHVRRGVLEAAWQHAGRQPPQPGGPARHAPPARPAPAASAAPAAHQPRAQPRAPTSPPAPCSPPAASTCPPPSSSRWCARPPTPIAHLVAPPALVRLFLSGPKAPMLLQLPRLRLWSTSLCCCRQAEQAQLGVIKRL